LEEYEKRILACLRAKTKEAKGLAFKAGQEENVRSLIQDMGSRALGEWKRLDTYQEIRDRERLEPEPYLPTSYYLCVIGVNVACAFGKDESPSAMELAARLSLVDGAIEQASKETSGHADN
jgi:hypothetical protein